MPTILEKIDNYLTESAGSPKKGDRFVDKKGKKATIISVGSGRLAQAGNNIEIKFDGEKTTRDVKMTSFFDKFKFLNEAIRFETGKFEASHGKMPKGQGNWAFEVKGKTIWVKGMKSFTDAKKQIKKDYKNDKSVFSITVLP